MKFSLTPDEQLKVISSGAAEIVSQPELKARLEQSCTSGKPLRVKLGADPSAPDIHLGHTVVLQKMKDFQDLGHEVVFLIGDFTGMVGDPTGKKKTRPSLSREEINANAETYKAQIGKILDIEKTVIDFNSRWLSEMTFSDVLKLSAQYTVARMLERDDFSNRYKNQTPIGIVEFMYPLMQGYDSVALKSDVELGGVDQTFNLLVGRELQRAYGQKPQITITMLILEGLDGHDKMSKSLGNYVGINEAPSQVYGKIMSIPDELMRKYFVLLTGVRPGELDEIELMIKDQPKKAKMKLARTLTARYHGEEAAQNAEGEFENMFGNSGDGLPDVIEETTVESTGGEATLSRILTASGLAPSGGEAKRLISQGGVKIDGEKVTNPQQAFKAGQKILVQAGKRKFRNITIA